MTQNNRPTPNWQPTLMGALITAIPLQEDDFNDLFTAASDPAIWAMHPVPDRYTRPVFEIFFRSAMESKGALLICDARTQEVIGSSRFCGYDILKKTVEIGYTFLKRSHWATGANAELKQLMIDWAFRYVETVEFFIGPENLRSRRAIEKLGATLCREVIELEVEGTQRTSVVYHLTRQSYPNLIKGSKN